MVVKKLIMFVLVCLLTSLIYINRNLYIESISWKSCSDNRISDFISFSKEGIHIKRKSIILENKTYGTIILCLHKYLIATNNDGDFCIYINKGFVDSNTQKK